MLLQRLELTNVCQHRHLVLEFAPGSNGIFGPNGVGKSNALSMAAASLTGDYTINYGTKTSNVRHGTAEGEASQIETHWVHEGTPLLLRRQLHAAGQQLTLGRGATKQVFRRANEITQQLTQLLGVSPKLAVEHMFIAQDRVYDFLIADPADRQRAFLELCRAERAEELFELLGKAITADAPLAGEFLDNSDELHQQLRQVHQQLAPLQQQIEKLLAQRLTKSVGQQLQQQQQHYQQRQSLQQEEQRYGKNQEELAEALAVAQEKLRTATQELTEHTQQTQRLTALAQQLRQNWTEKVAQQQLLQKRQQLLQIMKQELPAPPVPPQPDPPAVAAVELQLSQYRQELRQLEEQLRMLEQDGLSACPTCGTPMEQLEGELQTKRQRRETLLQLVQQAKQQLPPLQHYWQQFLQYQRATAQQEGRQQQAREQLNQLPKMQRKVLELPVTEEAVNEQQEYADVAVQQNAFLQTRQREAERTVDQCTGELAGVSRRLEACQQQLREIPLVSAEEAQQATVRLEANRTAKLRLEGLQQQVQLLHARQQEITTELERIAQLRRRTRVARKWLADLEFMRGIVHRTALPTRLVQVVLGRLIESTNERLEAFGSPFRCMLDDQLALVAVKKSGRHELARRLSGAQKVVLAICFRLAVLSHFRGRIGMLSLDEPTAGLDTDNMDFLADVLRHLPAICPGQQLIIITHDRRLERIFDRKLELTVRP